jgi:hypothetical protein
MGAHGMPWSLTVTLPPMGAVFFSAPGADEAKDPAP